MSQPNGAIFTGISIEVGDDRIAFHGSFLLPDVLPLITQWFEALPASGQRQIDALTARIAASNTALGRAVQDSTPTQPTS